MRRQGSQERRRALEAERRRKMNRHRSEPSCLRRQASEASIGEEDGGTSRDEMLELMDRRK